MEIELSYGTKGLIIEVPSDCHATVIRKPVMPIGDSPGSMVNAALDHPVACAPIETLASSAQSVCIAICDITRPVPNHLFLRPIVERLIRAGISVAKITVIVATGLHRPNEGDELRELIGDDWILDNIRVVNHFARRDDECVNLGETPTRATVVRINRRFVEADLRIVTGLVEPHFMAGYSGGRKLIAPGLAHAETITTFHSARFMANPAASNCNFDGNPLHEEQLEIVRMVGGAYALNTVIDEHRNLSMVNFGEVVQSHLEAVDFVRRYCEVPVPRRFKTVVTSSAGYPLDKTYYQTVKGMVGAIDILEPGGDLIIASECSEGMGSREFVEAQQRLIESGSDAFLRDILKKSHAGIDEWQTQMQLKATSSGNMMLFSDRLRREDYANTGVQVVDSVEKVISQSLERHGTSEIAVIPEGPYVVPFFRPELAADLPG